MTNLSRPTGFLLLDKPSGATSHNMVARVRRQLGDRKVGHAGTLDPMATGLLLLGVGPATRLLTFLVGLPKAYEATIRLGWGTTTDDAEGARLEPAAQDRQLEAATDERIAQALASMRGVQWQRPSAVSAVRVGGKRAYERVRAGEDVELPSRQVHISRLEIRGIRRESAHVDVDVVGVVSSGTYIRAIARDVGTTLGIGGHLTALRRTTVGPFSVTEALPPSGLDALVAADLLSPAEVVTRVLPVLSVAPERVPDIRNGRPWYRSEGRGEDQPDSPAPQPHAVIGASDEIGGEQLLAVVTPHGQRWRYEVVLPT